jgi:hypothetical protein
MQPPHQPRAAGHILDGLPDIRQSKRASGRDRRRPFPVRGDLPPAAIVLTDFAATW